MDLYTEEPEEEGINWRELIEKAMLYWKWVVASILLFVCIGFLYNRKQQQVYKLNTSVLVVDQAKNGGMNEVSMLKQLDAFGLSGSASMVNDEEQVIKSTSLMKRVVNQLELHTSYSHTFFLKTENLYTQSSLHVSLDSLALANLVDPLFLKISPDNGQLDIVGNYKDSDFTLRAKKLPAILKTPAGTILIERREGKAFPDATIDVTIQNSNLIAKNLADKALKTEVNKLNNVIKLSLQVSNVQLGQDVLNTLVDVYSLDAIEQVNRSANKTAAFIDERLKLLTRELTEVERNVEDYKQVNQLTDLTADAQISLNNSNVYDLQRNTVETQLHLIKYVEEFVQNPANKTALVPNLGLTDVGLVSVIEQYNSLVMTRDRIAAGSSDENPTLKTLTQQIQTARKAIQIGIGSTRKGLQISNNDLANKNSLTQSKIYDIPRKEREFIEIKRQQQVKETLYLFLLQKREEASLNMAVTVPKGRVLNSPDDAEKIGPKTAVNLFVFFLFGLFLPFGILFIKNLLNTSINNRSDVEKLTTIPILAELGHNTTGDIFIDHKSNFDTNAELFRLLRTKLQFVLDYPAQKVIMVTSTEPGEGKTFVSLNLAINLTLTDKKVLLLGLDLRKPMLARYLKVNKNIGVSTYLSGLESNYQSLIQTIKEFPMLDLLPGGTIPPNPSELIMKKRLKDLIQELSQVYDYIVIDTPPVGSVSDALLLNSLADITLYICRARYSDKRNIDFLNKVKAEGTLSRPYLIINDTESNKFSKGYSYGYGKYYGHK